MNIIRVLAVLSTLSAGGAETMYINLYRKLDKTKYKIDFLIFGDRNGFYADEVMRNGSRIFKMTSIRESGINGLCQSVEKCICENGPYDVVHSHIDYLSGFVMKIAKKCNVKIRLAHSHSTSAHTHKGSMPTLFMLYLRKLINRNATKRLACSLDAAEYMFGKTKVENAVIINNAIDLSKFSNVGQYPSTLDGISLSDKKVILHIGRFVREKNHRELIMIFDEYIKKYTDTILLLVGEGELKGNIIQLVNSLGLQENVKFLGVRSDIPELLALSDVFVLPSEFEGLPVTLIEAQAMNVPCVVSDNVKRGVDCGIDLISFIPLGDRSTWCEAIDIAAKRQERNNNYSVMTDNGYNIDKNMDVIERLYSGINE
jgi:glycosyltransferase EpsF